MSELTAIDISMSTGTTPEPLTAAGRALLDELSESPLPGARYARDVVARRLAAIELEAAAHPPATIPDEGLRESLRLAFEKAELDWPSRPALAYAGLRTFIRAVLSNPETGQELDVERLARALWAWGYEPTIVVRDDVKEPTEAQRRMARKLVHQYAALSSTDDKVGPKP